MIDRIEYHVEHAVDYVQTATQDTKKALRYQSRARRVSIVATVLAFKLDIVQDTLFNFDVFLFFRPLSPLPYPLYSVIGILKMMTVSDALHPYFSY